MLIDDFRAKARRKYGADGAAAILKAAVSDGSFAMMCYRAMQWSQRWHLAPLAMVFNKLGAVLGQCEPSWLPNEPLPPAVSPKTPRMPVGVENPLLLPGS